MTDFCYTYLNEDYFSRYSVVIMYPYSLRNESVLIENIKHIPEYIYEIIVRKEEQECGKVQMTKYNFDVDKEKCSAKLSNIQKEIDELSEKMNSNLSPYAWFLHKNIDSVIDNVHIRAAYACALERI